MRHRELLQAWTTAAVINYSIRAPQQMVSAELFMPSGLGVQAQPQPKKADPEMQGRFQLWLAKREQLALELKAGKGKLLEEVLSAGQRSVCGDGAAV